MKGSRTLGAIAIGYLVGTFPTADIVARRASGGPVDLRHTGTGNPGSANAAGVLGVRAGAEVIAGDIGKGAAACAFGAAIAGPLGAHVAGTAAVAGHCFPVWNGFRGGKGVAASVGSVPRDVPRVFPDRRHRGGGDRGDAQLGAPGVRRHGCVVGVLGGRRHRVVAARLAQRVGPCSHTGAADRGRTQQHHHPAALRGCASTDFTCNDLTVSRVIGLVTDSNSQITADLVQRFEVEVVPLTVTIDGVDHLEGAGLDADGFYARFAGGEHPTITTSQPSPGRLADAYRRLADRGCTDVMSIHLAGAMSGTVTSATLAARSVDVPVHVIDTGSASFGVAVCVWAAGVAIARGASPDDIRRRVANLVPRIGTAFMVGVPLLIERGGRAQGVDVGDDDGVPVLAMSGGELSVLERVATTEDAIDVMSTYAAGWGEGVTVAIGVADAPSRPLSDRLAAALRGLDSVDDVIEYRLGPSVGAHTGPGTFGLFVFPTIR